MPKIAVVAFNLGGPDRPEAVEPFLFNLFNDPAIIGLPWPVRPLLAKLISRRRGPVARAIYAKIGGGSPLLPLTREQAAALQAALAGDGEVKVFIAMRYWHPMSDETALAVKDFAPDEIVLLPLYPQYSTTTTASSVMDWERAARAIGLDVPTRAVCCYPTEPGFVAAEAELVAAAVDRASRAGRPRVLFSAHGLPKRVIEGGDPYKWQVERSAAAVVAAMGRDDFEWRVSFQSRVGPLEWIGPATDAEIERAGHEGKPLVVVPIAFVSEHSETLVELDIEYGELAHKAGVPAYERVPAVGTHPLFIDGLARLVRAARAGGCATISQDGRRICPGDRGRCGHAG
ncbi:ferrochelatase [Shumkonia mesophila]|uniref:ferrochelatase n=1 Tax=Shumkonia mesophila TaxID=2838854 RepID=UPI00293464CC|nr:ferrochelatase [Shumkonia mesophila]